MATLAAVAARRPRAWSLFRSFQKVPPGYQPFTVAQRIGAVVRNGGKLLAVGTAASLLGVGLTDGIILARQVKTCFPYPGTLASMGQIQPLTNPHAVRRRLIQDSCR